MQLTQTIVTALLAASSALASPTPATTKSMKAATADWTIEKMQRKCAGDDSSCTWTFGINPHDGKATTQCKYVVSGPHASRANPGGPGNCGDYTITSGWSGQFGEGNGFTTLSVVDNKKRQIAWPAYRDVQVQEGKVVDPDQSYPVQSLP
ncbi:protein family CysZ [Purpureocillium lavendulum]|uniref:Protein family CysZ n=1 Tax=Purpureocillium lavendulum TaxID=1247861 RepID=A0AB34FSV3_9HYPO|nr:protein family CysZ [Purpureocillium lavendulum]